MTLPHYAPQALLVLLTAANIVLIKALNALVGPLKNSGERCGMAHFELAGSAVEAGRIMAAWRRAGLEEAARLSIWLDFAFLLAYPLGLALACWMLADGGGGWFGQAGVCIGFAVLACAPLDAVENIALLRMLGQGTDDATARVSAACAAVKFFLAALAVLYVLAALALAVFS